MKHYCLKCGNELKEEQLICLKCEHCSFFDSTLQPSESIIGILTAEQIEANTQWTKYKCGKDGLTGHGYAAEDANVLNDIFNVKTVDITGRSNSKNGPDRISNGLSIQTKYCKTAKASVQAGFDKTGMYAYKNQILEVPSDQYEEALQIMAEKISSGKVEGVTVPEDASKIVKKGSITYKQAKNIARAGNIDSLRFDAKTQSIVAVSSFGISFTVNLGMMLMFKDKNNFDFKEAVQMAFLSGLYNGTITMASGILTSQVLRTQFGRNFAAAIQIGSESAVNTIYSSPAGKELVNNLAKTLWDKGIYGAAAKSTTIRFVRTNVIANLAVFIVTSVPETISLIQGKISRPQYIKNLVVTSTSIIGGTLGSFLGAYLGPYGMIGGGLAGGAIFGWASKKLSNYICKDDSERMYELIKIALIQLSHDYMIQTEDEFQRCMDAICQDKIIDTNLIKVMYSIGADDNNDFLRVQVAYEKFEYYFFSIIRQREDIKLRKEQKQEEVLNAIDDLGKQLIVNS